MRKDKIDAIKLRKTGLSYNDISRKLNVPKSTLSYWLKNIKLSARAVKKLESQGLQRGRLALIARNKLQTKLAAERALTIRIESAKQVPVLMKNKLFIIGIALYWAEGYKKGAEGSKWKSVDFANSDPDMIKIMMLFFRKICKVPEEKFKIQLIAHPNINIDQTVIYWSKLTGIPKTQFIKTCTSISKYSQNKRNKKSLTHGTIHIRINDVKLFFQIIGWLDGFKKIVNNR